MSASEATSVVASVFQDLPGILDEGVLGVGGLPCAYARATELIRVVQALRSDHGFGHLSLLTAQERMPAPAAQPADAEAEEAAAAEAAEQAEAPQSGLEMVYAFTRRSDSTTVVIKVALDDGDLNVPSLAEFWTGAEALEREVYDLFGVNFVGNGNMRRILLRDDFEGHPLRKSYVMGENGVSAETVAQALESHGDMPVEDEDHRPHTPFAEAEAPGDPVLHSERLILNMGPQHPSMHGVLHLWLALEGETVLAAEPTHGYLHRCIEKLAESRTYKACTALLDRSDYVSGFHTELAHMLALEELMEIEVSPKADYLRVLFSELCRISSHHMWFAATGLDAGAYTPFLYAFIDRERIVDVFETVTGGRMMFNYFRPGGVKDDLTPGIAEELRTYLKTFDTRVDEYEALLTGNEIFRARTRGVGFLQADDVIDRCVTGPMARAAGVDADLRRDEPYSAYGDIPVNVVLGEVGDTFDRYMVRVNEMRESARIALAALEGMPEGPHVTAGVPRIIKPPAGSAYRRVESPRGELGVLLVSDGTQHPWRLKVRSPAFCNLHSAPVMLEGCRIGDVVAAMGSVDVVMGEIDR